ncbi:hypothetical protein QTP88_012921 [Uroleucon formosanum]
MSYSYQVEAVIVLSFYIYDYNVISDPFPLVFFSAPVKPYTRPLSLSFPLCRRIRSTPSILAPFYSPRFRNWIPQDDLKALRGRNETRAAADSARSSGTRRENGKIREKTTGINPGKLRPLKQTAVWYCQNNLFFLQGPTILRRYGGTAVGGGGVEAGKYCMSPFRHTTRVEKKCIKRSRMICIYVRARLDRLKFAVVHMS